MRPRPVPVDVKAQKDVKAEAIVKEDSFIEQNDNGEDKKDDGNETSAEKESLVKARGMEIYYFFKNTLYSDCVTAKYSSDPNYNQRKIIL